MTQPKRIFVIGHMGAGKALFSEALAKKLGWQYIDANPSLERYIGKPLHEIIGVEGKEAFHACEAEIISHCITKEHIVTVLEEAVVESEKNRKLLSSEYVIYLKVSTPTQIERMKGGRVPLLPVTNLNDFLNKQHADRDHLYEEAATLTIESIAVDNDVNQVIAALKINK